jgi:tetratricopeptide (TPR) repeat protein
MMTTATTTAENAFHRCAQLLQELHHLIAAGQDDSDEAEEFRAKMDPFWDAMTEVERERIGGLSEDLYILEEGGAKQITMSSDERTRWVEEARDVLPGIFDEQDVDAALKFLRRPAPNNIPRYVIPFLQARCWERLGAGELSLLFMKEAERLDPRQAVCVLLLLERLGRTEEAADCAKRIIENPRSSAEELFQAAAALLRPDRARPNLQRIVPILERSLKVFRTTPKEERELPDGDRHIVTMLGFCHQELGNVKTAVQLFDYGLARYPGDAILLYFRGLALIDIDFSRALADLRKVIQVGFRSIWPYYFVAWDGLRKGNFAETWRLCLLGIEQPGGSKREQAQLHEWLGIAMAKLGQPIEWTLHHLGQAEILDPGNERIRHNRAIAEDRRATPVSSAGNGWMIEEKAIRGQAIRGAYPEDQPAPDLFVERSDASLVEILQPA